MAELFIELFSEEIPAKLQIDARQKIKQTIEERLQKKEIKFNSSNSFSTPQRLVFVIDGIPEKIEEKKKVIKGPKVDAPQTALEGFIKSNNLTFMDTIKMVKVTRSNFVESIHYGAAILINSDGKILKEWGNSNLLIYPRSALKPIQSLNLYKDGVAKALNLSDKLIALTTASHHAETIHQEMINKRLKKMNLNENHLSCGPTWPWNEKDQFEAHSKYKTKRKIFHNCSGKHCGHLAVCSYKNLPIKNYQNKDHPIQKDLIQLIEDLSKYKVKNIGVDGCTLPNPLIPLKKFAFATAQLADYKKLNDYSAIVKRIFNSCIKFPEIAGGSKSINSILTKI